jgi:Zn-dependent protease
VDLLSLLFNAPGLFVILAGLLLYSVIFHEVAHGWVAYLFGDDTAKQNGRLTLDPAAHIDPLGLLMLFVAGFGWAKPVPVDYYNLKHSRTALIAVSLAGCAANMLIAMAAIFLLHFHRIAADPVFSAILPVVVKINVILCAFNLIPIPPLDGSRILMTLLPEGPAESLARLEPYGFYVIIALLFTGLLNPVIGFMQTLIYALIALVFRAFG